MTNETDSFIQEVSEDLRRDRMFGAWRKYGPWIIGALALVVAFAAWQEWSKHRAQTLAMERGTAFAAADEVKTPLERAAAFEALAAKGGPDAPLARLRAGAAYVEAQDPKAAEVLEAAAKDPALSEDYRQLARLRALMAQAETMEPAALIAALEPLAAQDQPWRFFARELKAAAQIRAKDAEGARKTLDDLIGAPAAPARLIERARLTRQTLGPAPEAAPASVPAAPAAPAPGG